MPRIVTYNVRYFSHALGGLASTRRSLHKIAAAIARLDPPADIVCLQEVESSSLRSRLAWRSAPPRQLDALVDALAGTQKFSAHYFPAHVAGRAARPLYTTGLAILVDERLTVGAVDSIELTAGGDGGERRICAHLLVHDTAPLHVFNAHLSLPARPLRTRFGDGSNQLAQAQRLCSFVRERSGGERFILCGDFNSEPSSQVGRHLVDVEKLTSPPGDPGPTAGFGPIRMQLDYLFAGNGVRWIDRGEGDFRGLSDHLPLIARFA